VNGARFADGHQPRKGNSVMDFYLAQIILFGGNFVPRGWMACNGQMLPIAQNTALFSLLGTQYGGDGMTTFALPNLPPPGGAVGSPATPTYLICIQGLFPARD
jgi:microcystin-dependent protein